MSVLSVLLPESSAKNQQLLCAYQTALGVGVWTLLVGDPARELVHTSNSSIACSFILPYDFIYLGSLSSGLLLFLSNEDSEHGMGVYQIRFIQGQGIVSSRMGLSCDGELLQSVATICSPLDRQAASTTLSDSIILDDNAYAKYIMPALNVSYHSLHDVLRIRRCLPDAFIDQVEPSGKRQHVNRFNDLFPSLCVVDFIRLSDQCVALIANDSRIKTLSCDVVSRLFILVPDCLPKLALGHSIFSADNSLTASPSASELIHPSLGLVFSHSDPPAGFDETEASQILSVYSVNYRSTIALYSVDQGSSFTVAFQSAHTDSDLVPLLHQHLDYAQTLFYSSKLDRALIAFPAPAVPIA